jgi:regulator of cell morphogenesis and NO signaling
MSTLEITDRIGDIVARRPELSKVFEQSGIDYCCGGKKTLDEACRNEGIDPSAFLSKLEETSPPDGEEQAVDTAAMSLAELADHIEQKHHAYLRSELPRLDTMIEKVATLHGDREPRLHQLRETFPALAGELSSHMMKEERMLFPMVRQLEASDAAPMFHCGTLANPIRQMELEHDQAGSLLERLREVTNGYTSPEWACNTYRALLDGLAALERDLHQHIHKENNVLFPQALAMEERKGTAPRRS